jgi:hypothetical protein
MPINLTIQTGFGANRPNLSDPSQPTRTVGRETFNVSLYKDKTWHCTAPLPLTWRYFIPDFAGGRWHKEMGGTWVLLDQTGKKRVFELRKMDDGTGPVFHWPEEGKRGAVLYRGQGYWIPAPLPSRRVWGGLMVKGGGGLVAGGEYGVGLVAHVETEHTGAVLQVMTARAGLSGGLSGGAAILVCSGFDSVKEMDGFKDSGIDYTIAIGAKFSAVLKTSKLVGVLKGFEGGLESIEKAITLGRKSKLGQEVLKEAPGLAKTAACSYGLVIDTDDQQIVAIDLPLAGGGAEIGVFYGWSQTKVLEQW